MLSAAGVRRELLHEAGQAGILPCGDDPVAADVVDGALGRLAEGSLLAFTVDGQAVIAHRLVLRVVRDGLAAGGGGWRGCAKPPYPCWSSRAGACSGRRTAWPSGTFPSRSPCCKNMLAAPHLGAVRS